MTDNDYNLDLDNIKHDVDIEAFDLYGDDKNVDENNSKPEPAKTSIPNSSKQIDKAMMIEEIVTDHPDIIPMLMDYGVHCVGCGGATFETLEEGFMGHGMSGEEVDQIVEELNEFIKKNNS